MMRHEAMLADLYVTCCEMVHDDYRLLEFSCCGDCDKCNGTLGTDSQKSGNLVKWLQIPITDVEKEVRNVLDIFGLDTGDE